MTKEFSYTLPIESTLFLVAIVVLPISIILFSIKHFASIDSKVTIAIVMINLLVAAFIVVLSNMNKISLSESSLKVKAFGFYEMVFELRDIEVHYDNEHEHEISIRTNGVSFWGYHAGWFRSRSNRELFCLLINGDTKRLVISSKSNNKLMLLSVPNIEELKHLIEANIRLSKSEY